MQFMHRSYFDLKAPSIQFSQSVNLWGKWKWTLRESESPKCEIKTLFQVFLQPRSTPTQFQLQSHNSPLPVKISDRTSQLFFFVKRCSIGKWWVLKLEAKKILFHQQSQLQDIKLLQLVDKLFRLRSRAKLKMSKWSLRGRYV